MGPSVAEQSLAGPSLAGPGRRWGRRRLVVTLVALVVVAGVAVAITRLTAGSGTPPAAASTGTQTTAVVRTDLHETTPVNGTVGFASGYTIVEPSGNPASAVTTDQQAVAAAQQGLTADQTSQAGAETADAQSAAQATQALQEAQATLASDQSQLQTDQATLSADEAKEANDCQGDAAGSAGAGSGTQCSQDQTKTAADQQKVDQDQTTVSKDEDAVTSAQAGVTTARQKAAADSSQSQAKLTADRSQLANAQATLSSDQGATAAYNANSKYTSLPAVGQVIAPGQSLWSVNGQPVVLLPGVLSPWRAFTSGMSPGADVAVLNRALGQLGYGGAPGSDSFTSATAAAIDGLQSARGMTPTGALDLGAAVFSPTPVRVTAVHPTVGDNVGGGQPVLDVTSTTPVINLALPVDQSYLVKVGDPVTANLPDGSTAPGTITGVGSVATSTSSGNGNQPSATINVTVALSHPSPAGSLDQAPVTVNITNQSADNVLAVPTTALLALAGGGYALEVVDPGGVHHLVAVTTGIFDDQSGLVQVSGAGLAEGQKVVVPSS